MNIQLGWVYKFIFTDDFTGLNGVYVLVKESTYEEMISEGQNLYDNLYKYAGLEESDLEINISQYKQEKILKILSVKEIATDETQPGGITVTTNSNLYLYVPESIVQDVPIHNVKQYNKLVIAWDVGVYPGETDLEYMKNSVYERLQAELGYSQPPDVISIDKVWLTDSEYDTLKTQRDENIIGIVNYYSENIKLRAEIDKLKATITNYEKIIQNI